MAALLRRDLLWAAGALVACPMGALGAEAPPPGLARLYGALNGESEMLAPQPQAAIARIRRALAGAAADGAFEPWAAPGPHAEPKTSVLSGGSGLRRWKVQIFHIPAGTSHPPHCHENLISCLVVLRGRLRLREYHRDRAAETEDWTLLSPAFDGLLAPGEGMVTTENHRNAHWFGAVGGPAVAVNFKASGYVRPELLRFRNRRYLDPTATTGPGLRAPFISRAAAHERFAGRML